MRFHAVCDFAFDAALTRVHVHLAPEREVDFASVLLASSVLSCLLTLRGHHILHASAVTLPGSRATVAFVGPSGSGKSTLAAALCTLGAELVSDDALRYELTSREVSCFPATNQLRMRESAQSLARALGPLGRSPDNRITVARPRQEHSPRPLLLLIVPHWWEDERLGIERLKGHRALGSILAATRIQGWRDPAAVARQFEAMARLARMIPTTALRLPRDMVFSPEGRRSVADCIHQALQEDARDG